MKIAVIGHSGSGKSTLARELADHFDIPVLYLDTVQYLPNWVERDQEEGRAAVKEFMKNDSWVIDGNYAGFYQEERLLQADRIIFMDFARITCFFRVLKRYLHFRNTTRESMTEGCLETLDLEFAWWILYKGRTRERRNRFKQIKSRYHEKITVLKNQRQLDEFKKQMDSDPA